jgi:serine/threonine protein kinase/WD40 repeat protein
MTVPIYRIPARLWMSANIWIGKTIGGRYQIEALLGQGGMSAVYRATDPNLRRPVAIKVIHSHLSDDPRFVDRFKEEAAAVARLRHPNIVQVHDFNVDGDTYYMVMEYLVGETLQARLRRLNNTNRHMPLQETLELGLQVCAAAGYAHLHELIHRDIKPANIMIDVNGQAILMDFGIVKIIGGDYHTATGATIGTAKYMSPEQIRSERVDERADIYSLGVTLYEMLSGQPPYLADSALTLMMMVLNDPLPDLRQARPGVPPSLAMVMERTLAKVPGERFQSMDELAAALRTVQADLSASLDKSSPTETDESLAAAAKSVVAEKPATLVDASAQDFVPMAPRQEQSTATTALATGEMGPAGTALATGLSPGQVDGTASALATGETSRASGISSQAETAGAATALATAAAASATTSAASPPLETPARPATRSLTSRRWVLLAGLLALVVIFALTVLYLFARRPPELTLMPVNPSAEKLTASNAPAIVNLGRWETNAFIEELTFSPDGSLLGTANNRDRARFSPYRFYNGLWQVGVGLLENYLTGHDGWIYAVAFSPDGQLFGSVSDDATALLWRVEDNILVQTIESTHGGLTALAFSPNSRLLATTSWDGILSLWQIDNGNLLRTYQGSEYALKDVNFSPDGAILAAAADDGSVFIWRVNDGGLIRTIKGHNAPVYEVIFSPDGTLLASASEDRTVNLWQVSDGQLLYTLSSHQDAVYGVAFSPDGSLLASGSGDGVLNLWSVADGALLSSLGEHEDNVKSVAFSPDGKLLASGAADGAILFWGLSEAIP